MRRKYKKFLKAAYIDYSEDYCGYGSSTFTKPTVTTPIIVITGTSAIIACAVSGATIYYTLDGSTPTSSSTEYTGAITLTQSCTIKAIAVKPGLTDSAVASESYVHYLTAWRLAGNSSVHTDPYLTSWKVSGNSEVHTLPYPDGIVLPTGYKRCEYLRNNGTAYIEVPFGFDKTDEVYLKGAFTINGYKDKYMVSPKVWNDDTNRFGLGTISQNVEGSLIGYISCSIGSTPNVLKPLMEVSLDILEFEYKDYICRVGNSSSNYTNVTFGSTTQNLRLFYGFNSVTNCKIYEYRHKKANAEYRLIPCLDSNDTPCMYDVINNQAYYNSAGSGSFTYKLYPQPTEIWSCGDYSDVDGKYHVKISNGVNVFDIALTEPLRKVNDVADTIEFPSNTEGKALVTRPFASILIGNVSISYGNTNITDVKRKALVGITAKSTTSNNTVANILCSVFEAKSANSTYSRNKGISVDASGKILIFDPDYTTTSDYGDFKAAYADTEVIYELATPTTELVDVSPIAVSPTDTYTSANVVPYSAFEHTENKEIWSCGEYNPIDGKWHILVQPQGGSIADIALDEPLRKVNDVDDTIEFPSGTEGKALVIRPFGSILIGNASISSGNTNLTDVKRKQINDITAKPTTSANVVANILCCVFEAKSANSTYTRNKGISVDASGKIQMYDPDYNTASDINNFKAAYADAEVIYELATPTTELVDAPQIEEADSYTCVTIPGSKALSWSSFETE